MNSTHRIKTLTVLDSGESISLGNEFQYRVKKTKAFKTHRRHNREKQKFALGTSCLIGWVCVIGTDNDRNQYAVCYY